MMGPQILHILPETFRSGAHRTLGTPPLLCSIFEQTALKSETPGLDA